MERTRNDKREYFFSPASFCKMQSHWNASMWVYYSEQRYFIGFWINVTQNVIQKNFSASIADLVSWSEISIQKEEKMPKMAKRSDVHIEINTPIHMPQSPLAYNSISCLWVFWTKFIRYAYTIYISTDIWSPLESNAYCPTSRICFKLKVSDIIIAVSGKIPKHMYCSAHKWYAFLILWLQSQSVSIWI